MNDSFYRMLMDNLSEGIYFVDTERKITYWNHGAERLTGFLSDEVKGKLCRSNILMHVDNNGLSLCRSCCPAALTLNDGQPREIEAYLHHKEGHRVPVLMRLSPIRNDVGEITGVMEVFSDNTVNLSARDQIEKLQVMALLDPLTEVGNRRFAEVCISARLNELNRYGWKFGLLFIDVDGFRSTCEKYGHDISNRLLRMIARTIRNRLRCFDDVARWGEDEFVAAVSNVDSESLSIVANTLRRLIEESGLIVETGLIQLTASIGATLAESVDSVGLLVERSEQLIKQAKTDGRNRIATRLNR
ncbi:MAG TPA: sensor domain-containing diguanylate cyclase [bacterium]|nr:sensor domain-containing diguanylate cyclase [bacterium]